MLFRLRLGVPRVSTRICTPFCPSGGRDPLVLVLLAGAVWLCLPSPVGVSTLLVYALEGRQTGRALGPLKSPCLHGAICSHLHPRGVPASKWGCRALLAHLLPSPSPRRHRLCLLSHWSGTSGPEHYLHPQEAGGGGPDGAAPPTAAVGQPFPPLLQLLSQERVAEPCLGPRRSS